MKRLGRRFSSCSFLRHVACAALLTGAACDDSESKRINNDGGAAMGGLDAGDAAAPDVARSRDAGDTDAGDTKAGATAAGDAASGDAALTAAEVVGYYAGDWGDMVLREMNGEIWGAYTHDMGTIIGTFQNGVLVGWWSEVQSRLPNMDAGEVEFRFGLKNGQVFIDGRWKYGTAEAWREDWDIGLVKMPEPAALVARFNDPGAFRRHP